MRTFNSIHLFISLFELYIKVNVLDSMIQLQVDEDTPGLPVMVFLHGGGWSRGHAQEYDGRALAAKHSIVVVTLSFRLGALGKCGGHP